MFKYLGNSINVFFNDTYGIVYIIVKGKNKKLIEQKTINDPLLFDRHRALIDSVLVDTSFNVYSVFK